MAKTTMGRPTIEIDRKLFIVFLENLGYIWHIKNAKLSLYHKEKLTKNNNKNNYKQK